MGCAALSSWRGTGQADAVRRPAELRQQGTGSTAEGAGKGPPRPQGTRGEQQQLAVNGGGQTWQLAVKHGGWQFKCLTAAGGTSCQYVLGHIASF